MNSQLEFQAMGGGRSQSDRALDLLCQRAPNWVSMPELETASGSHRMNSRIAELRKRIFKDGWTIENKTEWKDGQCHSYYRLLRLTPTPEPQPQPTNTHDDTERN